MTHAKQFYHFDLEDDDSNSITEAVDHFSFKSQAHIHREGLKTTSTLKTKDYDADLNQPRATPRSTPDSPLYKSATNWLNQMMMCFTGEEQLHANTLSNKTTPRAKYAGQVANSFDTPTDVLWRTSKPLATAKHSSGESKGGADKFAESTFAIATSPGLVKSECLAESKEKVHNKKGGFQEDINNYNEKSPRSRCETEVTMGISSSYSGSIKNSCHKNKHDLYSPRSWNSSYESPQVTVSTTTNGDDSETEYEEELGTFYKKTNVFVKATSFRSPAQSPVIFLSSSSSQSPGQLLQYLPAVEVVITEDFSKLLTLSSCSSTTSAASSSSSSTDSTSSSSSDEAADRLPIVNTIDTRQITLARRLSKSSKVVHSGFVDMRPSFPIAIVQRG